jgi:ubiquinone/menaquinone biosynthesis C-methylase UbiE
LQKKDYRIVFLDFSEAALKGLMYRLNREGKVDKVTIIRDDFYNNELCFSDQYFDVSYNVGVIEHFDDPVKALNNMKRIAKNVICVVPAPSIVWKIGTVIRKLIEKDASQWTEHTRYYSLDELKHIFIEAHLKDTHFKQINVLGLPFCNFAQGES